MKRILQGFLLFSLVAFSAAASGSDISNKKLRTMADWASETESIVSNSLSYPDKAWEAGKKGTAIIRLTLNKNGGYIRGELIQSSGDVTLDTAAKDLTRDLSFPALPDDYSQNDLTFDLAISYELVAEQEN